MTEPGLSTQDLSGAAPAGPPDLPSRAVMILAYGQSNAEAYQSGPRPDAPILQDARVETLTSGNGVRGHGYAPDGQRKTPNAGFWRDGRKLKPADYARSHPMADSDPGNSSILHAAAATVIARGRADKAYVRAASRGGAQMIGTPSAHGNRITGIFRLEDGAVSPILSDLIETARDFRGVAAEAGHQLGRVYVLLVHGEADRATAAGRYLRAVLQAKAEVTARLRAEGLGVHWLVTQTAGTSAAFAGNAWPSRLAALDLQAGIDPDMTFLGPLYPYALADGIHHDAGAKALIGELAGLAIARLEAGDPWATPRPALWRMLDPHRVEIEVETEVPLAVDPGMRGYDTLGFSLAEPARNTLLRAEVFGNDRLHLHFAEPVTADLELGYAWRLCPSERRAGPPTGRAGEGADGGMIDGKGPLDTRAFGGGAVRTRWVQHSTVIAGARHHHWLPGFRVTIRPELGQGRITSGARLIRDRATGRLFDWRV